MTGNPECQVAECLLPGVAPAAAEALAGWARPEPSRSARDLVLVRGLLLMPEDEVLPCPFVGAAAEVRAVSEWVGLARRADCGCMGLGWRWGREGWRMSAPGRAGRQVSGRGGGHPECAARTARRPWKREE
jgi:hypothetical protein